MTPKELEFLEDFERCTLPADRWTHRAHIHLAWLRLSVAPPAVALAKIRRGILRFNTVVLDRRLQYHETVTVAFTRLVAAARKPDESFDEFCQRNPALLARSPPVLARHYTRTALESPAARAGFVPPDLEPLPAEPSA